MAPERRTHGRLVLNCGGGLGNQMFEYAAGLFFARKFGRTLEVVRPLPQHRHWNGYARPFQLTEFELRSQVRETTLQERLFFSGNPRLTSLHGVAGSLLSAELINEPAIYEFHPEVQDTPNKRVTFLKGNWQAAGYVQGVEGALRQEFVLKKAPAGKNLDYAQQIAQLGCPVSLHLRIGDYALISHPTGSGSERVSMILRAAYYERAIAAMEELYPRHTLVVFSDDVANAKTFLAGRENCLFVEGNGPETAYEDMRLMSLCRHHIIANSSFSWWGAWLNAAPEKRVFAPKYWGNTPSTYFPDLYPADWVAVENL